MNEIKSTAICVVVADKSPLVQSGLENVFSRDGRFMLLRTVANGQGFLDAIEEIDFDLGVIGWDMPGQSGSEVLQALRKYANPPRVVIYTGNSAPDIPRRAMQLGGAGFCSKSEALDKLVETLIAVSEGRMVFPFMDMSRPGADPFGSLTSREQELLAALSRGSTNAQIANELQISLNTVKFHLKNLYGKLSVKNRAQAVASYLRSHGGERLAAGAGH